jgi:hypothetical protein
MPQRNPLGLIAGLPVRRRVHRDYRNFNRVTLVQAPIASTAGYELAGSSRPAK